jgi:hypothetical protein
LKLTSTFIHIALIEMVVREMFLFKIATPWLSSGHKTLWARRTWSLSMPQPTCLETLTSLIISLVIDIFMSIFVVVIEHIYCISQYIVSALWYEYDWMSSIYLIKVSAIETLQFDI